VPEDNGVGRVEVVGEEDGLEEGVAEET